MTILILDDEPSVLRLLANAVESKGYEVLRANGSEEALTLCESRETFVDLLISDVAMPRMNGRALADGLYRKNPDAPVIFISGFPRSRQLSDLLAARGFTRGYSFLPKPFNNETLFKAINAALLEACPLPQAS